MAVKGLNLWLRSNVKTLYKYKSSVYPFLESQDFNGIENGDSGDITAKFLFEGTPDVPGLSIVSHISTTEISRWENYPMS